MTHNKTQSLESLWLSKARHLYHLFRAGCASALSFMNFGIFKKKKQKLLLPMVSGFMLPRC